jgi:Sulfotransferase family
MAIRPRTVAPRNVDYDDEEVVPLTKGDNGEEDDGEHLEVDNGKQRYDMDRGERDSSTTFRLQDKKKKLAPPWCCWNCCRRRCWTWVIGIYLTICLTGNVSLLIKLYIHPDEFWHRNHVGPATNIHDLLLLINGYRMDVPMWMQKNLSSNPSVPQHRHTDKEICFVHVGKTAGSTLACKLGFLYGPCRSAARNRNETMLAMARGTLPRSTTHIIHNQYNDCQHHDFDYYLFVVRDPLQRIQSWFNYELPYDNDEYDTATKRINHDYNLDVHRAGTGQRLRHLYFTTREEQKRPLFIDCEFDTLNKLGEVGLDQTHQSRISDVCHLRAVDAIVGNVGYSTHNYYNFGYYWNAVRQRHKDADANVSLLVIRTEHLTNDWRSVEETILDGPRGLNVTFDSIRHASPKRPEAISLSAIAQERICAALCHEIQIYKSLLQNAVNLHLSDVEESMKELQNSCPDEADKDAC